MRRTELVSIPRRFRQIAVCGIAILLLLLRSKTNVWVRNTDSTSIQQVGERQEKQDAPVTLKVVLLSDTHGRHRNLTDVPDGDILVFAGDMSYFGRWDQVVDFNNWLGELPHRHKFVVAGNHDGTIHMRGKGSSKEVRRTSLADLPSLLTHAHYLQDSGFTVRVGGGREDDGRDVRIWGSPWQPQYRSFETHRPPGPDGMAGRWDLVPDDTTILIAHTPPAGVMDGDGRGCVDLASRIEQLRARRPSSLRLVAFGHFHEYGTVAGGDGLTYINCAVTDGNKRLVHSPHMVSLEIG